MNRTARLAARERAALILDHRTRRNGWPKGFDEDAMTIEVGVSLYLSREEAEEKGLPSPEDMLLDEPYGWDPCRSHHWDDSVPTSGQGPWSVWTGLEWTVEDEQIKWYYEGVAIKLPATFEVCDTCRGKGKHVNPNIDCMGLTRRDFDRDPGFEEAYFRGDYDVPCNACRGRRVFPVVDRNNADPCLLETLDERARYEAEDRAERAAEARMGAWA